ncbi:MAG: PAS domain-containing sensor histidine kinase [Calditrichaceae bacterium]|jgi:PAS domain S-box-containing protein
MQSSRINKFIDENYFQDIFNSIGDGVFVNRLLNDSKFGIFVEANKQACALLNFSCSELLKLSFYNLVSIGEQAKFKLVINQLREKGLAVFEIDLYTKNGPKVPVEINMHLINLKNELTVISVIKDTSKRTRNQIDLTSSREQLRNLALRLQNIREEERTLIAREIHDELGQLLTVLKIQVSLISKKVSGKKKEVDSQIQSSKDLIDQAINTVQKISSKLRPGILDELGLIPAIEWYVKEFEQLTGIQCECSLTQKPVELNPEQSTALFRITQEALTNVARHSLAKRVSVYLKNENGTLVLEITDNGIGIHQFQIDNPNSLGLLGIKERAIVFGGKVSINGVPDKGTNLKIEWPLKHD